VASPPFGFFIFLRRVLLRFPTLRLSLFIGRPLVLFLSDSTKVSSFEFFLHFSVFKFRFICNCVAAKEMGGRRSHENGVDQTKKMNVVWFELVGTLSSGAIR